MEEIFVSIKGFEGRYKVSNYGRVISENYLNTGREREMRPILHHTGYLYVHLGKDSTRSVHSLVAEAFIKNPKHYPFVNHIDGNKKNNCADNLEWVTAVKNVRHAITTGLRNPKKNGAVKGANNPQSKPVLQYSKDGVFVKRWECISDAARHIGCRPAMISNNASGRTLSCHGYVWEYADE